MIGRPSKLELDDLVAQRIINCIAEGGSRTAAAAAAHVHRSTLLTWLRRGREGEAPYEAFYERVREAEWKAESKMVDCIRNAATSDPRYWQAAAWWLERMRPHEWGKREPTQEQEDDRAESGAGDDIAIAESVLSALKSKRQGGT